MCYFHSDTQSPGTVSETCILRNYVSTVCHSATDILQQAAGLIARNYKLFEALAKLIATEITGLCFACALQLIWYEMRLKLSSEFSY